MRLFFLALLLATSAFAGWGDRAPTYVDSGSMLDPDVHVYSGSKRSVRIGNTIFYLVPDNESTSESESIFKSTDGGTTWTHFDSVGRYGGCIVTGKDSMVYVFEEALGSDALRYKKFRYNASSASAAVQFYTHADISNSGKSGLYRMVSCAVDSAGIPYAAFSWAPAASPTLDRVYTFWWTDTSLATVRGPYLASNNNSTRWYYANLEIGLDNKPVMSMYNDTHIKITFTKDDAYDSTWGSYSTIDTSNGTAFWSNPVLLVKNSDSLMAFYQSGDPATVDIEGGIVKTSIDGGVTWSARRRIAQTCGYFDPSGAVGSDGAVYVAGRDGGRASGSSCGDSLFSYLFKSTDFGVTWTAVDSAPPPTYQRVGTRSHLRYQNWWNYGGPLNWTWMGVMTGKKAAMFDVNTDVTIMSVTAPVITAHPSNQTVAVGATANFSCLASGEPNPTYQWQKNGTNIGGATSTSYTTPATTTGDNGNEYRCVATNAIGVATSNVGILTVVSSGGLSAVRKMGIGR